MKVQQQQHILHQPKLKHFFEITNLFLCLKDIFLFGVLILRFLCSSVVNCLLLCLFDQIQV